MKAVVLYYAKTDTYMVVDHNLDDVAAERECKQLRADTFPALTLTQKGKHRAKDPEECKACSKLVAEKRKDKRA
jgi:hypothetical protein